MKREEIFQYVKEQYGTEPEYLWKKDPDSAVLRHKNGKWYAIIMAVENKDKRRGKMKRKLFCEYGPTAYQISVTKEAILKDLMILTS